MDVHKRKVKHKSTKVKFVSRLLSPHHFFFEALSAGCQGSRFSAGFIYGGGILTNKPTESERKQALQTHVPYVIETNVRYTPSHLLPLWQSAAWCFFCMANRPFNLFLKLSLTFPHILPHFPLADSKPWRDLNNRHWQEVLQIGAVITHETLKTRDKRWKRRHQHHKAIPEGRHTHQQHFLCLSSSNNNCSLPEEHSSYFKGQREAACSLHGCCIN